MADEEKAPNPNGLALRRPSSHYSRVISTSPRSKSRLYFTLDGLRGVAALAVMTVHGSGFVYESANAYIAVDFFFLLSGFVIADAYGARLESSAMTPWRFMLIRYVRLWPLYLLGTMIGLAYLYFFKPPALGWAFVPLTLLMIPSPARFGTWYPANYPAWSLVYELVANGIYAATARWLTTAWLWAVVTICGAAILYTLASKGVLDPGFSKHAILISLARVGFSFTLGLLLHRYRERLPRFGIGPWWLVAALAALLLAPVPLSARAAYLAACIVVIFPLIAASATQVEPGRRTVGAMTFLGVASYPLYVIHVPIFSLLAHSGVVPATWTSGLFVIPATVVLAWMAARVYDLPVRRRLTAWLLLAPPRDHSRAAQKKGPEPKPGALSDTQLP